MGNDSSHLLIQWSNPKLTSPTCYAYITEECVVCINIGVTYNCIIVPYGRLDSVEWNGGLERWNGTMEWTGTLEWNDGMDWNDGMIGWNIK